MSIALIAPTLEDIETILTIRIPKRAKEGEEFRVRGRLKRADNNRAISNQKIDLYIDEEYYGSEITDRRGNVNFTVRIDEYGTYQLIEKFEGATI